ncbi:MAG: DUF1778 domain-containing protein [Candidatus Rhabdochlamydia sp.]|jgi:uncharacterized protein (DUF1778 family)
MDKKKHSEILADLGGTAPDMEQIPRRTAITLSNDDFDRFVAMCNQPQEVPEKLKAVALEMKNEKKPQ